MMDQAIKNFAQQFKYQPKIENAKQLKARKKFVVCGLGGSHLAADILLAVRPDLDIMIHRDYGLPAGDLSDRLIIASSYSGNTEEVIDAFKQAKARRLPLAVVAVGGQLIDLARQNKVAYVQMPDTGIQPRSALGFSFLALLKLMNQSKLFQESQSLARFLKPAKLQSAGKSLARQFKGQVPVIYASSRNFAVAYNWKIKLNETGKIPAFYNLLSELNHNEMTGFDVKPVSHRLSDTFHFVFLQDVQDQSRILKRFRALKKQYKKRGLPVEVVKLTGKNRLEKIFSSLILADWFAFYTAEQYGLESEQVPMVEEFKRLIKSDR